MNLLISAYACEPGQGSEPGVGWNVAREVSKYCHVWVLTSNCHRSGIEAELARNPIPNLHFVYIDPFGWIIDWSPKGKHTQKWVYFHYYLWQIRAYFVSRSLHQDICFDISHHVTYVKYSSPSFLALLPIPFIWGPVGGGELAPKAFWQNFSWRGKIYESLRNLARLFGENDPFVRLTARRSILAWATTKDTAQRLHQMGAKNVQILPESGLSKEEIQQLAQHNYSDILPIRFISMARLLHWKGFHLGVQAFAKADLPQDTEYWILGDGPELERLKTFAEELGVANQVKFWGRLSRNETLCKLSECAVLVHPSLHDSGGWVCLEAMAAGCPVICLDLGGPSVQVTEETGFKIQANTPEEAVQGIAKAMLFLVKDPGLRLRMGEAGQKRVKDVFSWETKGFFLFQLYKEICTQQ
ncbi:glycosyltransferase [Nostocales cyanobacterium LEGE 11386]|nr:glycosyltransferase [Nostocales cyanobacterium LEGE 11386]